MSQSLTRRQTSTTYKCAASQAAIDKIGLAISVEERVLADLAQITRSDPSQLVDAEQMEP
jgi:hypothetical protein